MKKYVYFGILAATTAACSDSFLDEKMVSTITQEYFETEQGLDQLVVGTYNAMRIRYGYGEGSYMFEMGHDCGMVSGNSDLNKFSPSVWSSTGTLATQTNYFMGFQSKQQEGFNINAYPIIDNCNKAIISIRSGKALGKYASDEAYANQRLAEALFNRDYLFYSLNTVLGDIYVPTTSITAMPDNFYYPRETSEDLYKMMIGDLRFCVENLPESYSGAEFGRITKYTAAHQLAKLYLQRAQGAQYEGIGRNADGTINTSDPQSYLGMLYKGNKSSDLDSCIYYTSLVINSGKHALEPNYEDIFKCGIGDWSNESSSEILLPALFANGTDNYRYGLRICSFYVGNYTSDMWGIPSYTWENDTKGAFGFMNNDWGYDVFTDKVNDARYQGTFRLEYKTALQGGTSTSPALDLEYYAYDNKNNKTYEWTEEQAAYFNQNILGTYDRESWGGRQAVAGQHKMGTNDLAFAVLENTKETAIDVEVANAQPFVLFARWMKKDGKYFYRPEVVASGKTYSFVNAAGISTNYYGLEKSVKTGTPTNKKFHDPNRNTVKDVYGTRDVPVIRFAETYLLRAEAYGRKGDYANALFDINKVRERGAFKDGDRRVEVLARLYPGSEELSADERSYPYIAKNSVTKMKADASFWDGSSEASKLEDYPSSATSDAARFIHFICNEYAREFNQEVGPYYEQIHHAGVQAERVMWHHQMASSTSTNSPLWNGVAADNINGTNGQTGKAKGNFQPYNTFKPFPKTEYLDLLTDENGVQLDESAKAAYQNYGY